MVVAEAYIASFASRSGERGRGQGHHTVVPSSSRFSLTMCTEGERGRDIDGYFSHLVILTTTDTRFTLKFFYMDKKLLITNYLLQTT